MYPIRPSLRSLAVSCGALSLGLLLGIMVPAFNAEVRAGDWPQILGPQRDGHATLETPLAAGWDKASPKVIWRMPAGSGYSGAVIGSGQAFLFDRTADSERITAVDLKTGQQRWQTQWPATYVTSIDPDNGPRAVPIAVAGSVICYGAAGDLVCLNSASGKVVWQRPLRKEFDADDGYFGAGSSPLVIGDTVIVNVGGNKAGIVGIDLKTGKTRWQATEYSASYSSPVALTVDGKPAALVVTRLRTVLLDAATGEVWSEIDFGARGATVVAATPLPVGGNRYLLTASYDVGALLIKVDGKHIERLWKQADLLASQYNSPVLMGGIVIAVDGREDRDEMSLKGIDIDKPEVLWERPLPGPEHLIVAGNKLLELSIDGSLTLSDLENNKLRTAGSFTFPQSAPGRDHYRALPALADHVLIVRRTQDANHSEFIALELP